MHSELKLNMSKLITKPVNIASRLAGERYALGEACTGIQTNFLN